MSLQYFARKYALFAIVFALVLTPSRAQHTSILNTASRYSMGSTGSNVVLTSGANPSTLGQLVTLTANVSPSTATGTVTFFDGVSILGIRPLTAGQAVLSTPLLDSGSQLLRATYSGSVTYAASTSAAITQTVNTVAAIGFVTAHGTVRRWLRRLP